MRLRRSLPTLVALPLLGLLAAAGALQAQTAPQPDSAVCDSPSFLVPESLQSAGFLFRTLPRLAASSPTTGRTWSTAASLGRIPVCGEQPWLSGWTSPEDPDADGMGLLPSSIRLTANSAWPVERGNGLQWAGKGLSGVVRAGWGIRSGALTVALRPEVAWAENRDFAVYDTTLVDRDPLAYPWHARRIDWPQRHGRESVLWVGPGESRVAADLGAVELAVSSEQVTWGPSLAYPLLLGPSGPGFPHVSFSSLRPLRLGSLGSVEAQLLWGMLEESEFFDTDASNDRRLLSGVVLSFRPAVFPGFSVGAASLVQSSWSDFSVGDLFNFVQTPTEGDDSERNVEGNGLGSIFARWAIPGSGFEAWVEWARDDYSFDATDLISEPDHTQAYSAGFQQVGRWNHRLVRLSGELTHLTNEEPPIQGGRSREAAFYTHAFLGQGHTHRGQLLGSPVGPGSDAQQLSLDILERGHLWGLRMERVRWNDDAYVRNLAETFGAEGHDVELTLGLRHARPVGPGGALRLHLEGDAMLRRNRIFANLGEAARTGSEPDLDWASNVRLQATLSWVPGPSR